MSPRFVEREFQVRCLHCAGSGYIRRYDRSGVPRTGICSRCNGTGTIKRRLEIAESVDEHR